MLPGRYRATVRSGGNTAISDAKTASADEVEFDFDSNSGGATRIAPDFIQGLRVSATLLDGASQVVASSVVTCEWK